MVFNWEDGYTRSQRPLTSICGLTHSNKRPVSVTLTYDDLRQLLTHEHSDRLLKIINCALTKNA